MSLSLDREFARRASYLFDGFEERSDGKFVFRCPYCGDSKRSKTKKRGGLIQHENGYGFTCKNCGVGKPFGAFLSDYDSRLGAEYRLEIFKEKAGVREAKNEMRASQLDAAAKSADFLTSIMTGKSIDSSLVINDKKFWDTNLEPLTALRSDHPAIKYLADRGIGSDSKWWSFLGWTDDFCGWRNHKVPDKEKLSGIEGRIVIPMVTSTGEVVGAQGRSLKKSGLRYVTVVWKNGAVPRSGENLLKDGRIWVVEGPFDAMAMENGIAVLHADLAGTAEKLGLPKRGTVLVFDNEPGNRQVVDMLRKAVDKGWKVGFWKDRQADVGKDVADAVFGHGLACENLFRICDGVMAKVELGRWIGKLS